MIPEKTKKVDGFLSFWILYIGLGHDQPLLEQCLALLMLSEPQESEILVIFGRSHGPKLRKK